MKQLIIHWSQLKKQILKFLPSNQFILLDEIATLLNEKAYVYRLEYAFTEDIYLDGQLQIPNHLGEKEKNFLRKELDYSKDPLGLIVEGYVEVYIHQVLSDEISEPSCLPIKRLNAGEFTGTFGASDFLVGINDNEDSEWSISAGSKSFQPIIPNPYTAIYKNELEQVLEMKMKNFPRGDSKMNEYKYNFPKFIKKISFFKQEKWNTNIIFFPRHWFGKNNIDTIKLQNEILISSWKQSTHYRKEAISQKRSQEILNQLQGMQSIDTHFFSSFPIAIEEILKGNSLLIKPVHLNPGSILDKFEKYLNEKFQKETKLSDFRVQIFEYDYLNAQPNDWGFLSLSIAQLIGQRVFDIPKRTYKRGIALDILEAMEEKLSKNDNLLPHKSKVWIQANDNKTSHPINQLNQTDKKIAYHNYRHFNSYIVFINDGKSERKKD